MTIRPATKEDIPKLERLIAVSVRALSLNYYSTEQIESALVNIFGVDTQLIKDGTYYVAEIDGRIAGCGGWSKRQTLYGGDQTKEGADPLLNPATEPARIRAFFVHPSYARRGIGTSLIDACEQSARSANFNTIELAATLPGEPLYKALGYQAVERFDIALPDGLGLPVVRMRKEI
jgi:N-acetylglutamate synthase-like GNAT family acetyltransferase